MISNPIQVLIMGYVWPELTSSAAGLRDWNLIESFLSVGWRVTFSSSSQMNPFSEQLQKKGVEVVSLRPNDPQFDAWIKINQPDFIIFDRFVTEEQFGWRVAENSPRSIRILDTQDLHFLRRSRQEAVQGGKSLNEVSSCHFDLVSETSLREIASIYRSDCTLILSDFEIKLLVERFQVPSHLLFLSRFHYLEPPATPGFGERKHFVMIGNFRHLPNSDGVSWLRHSIWPLIREQLPEAEVHIYGAYPSKAMMHLTDEKIGFIVKGPIEDHHAMLKKYRVNLAPLRFGAGIKGKITDGWFAGTPVVTTFIGSEGMSGACEWGGKIAEDSCDFSQKCIQLYSEQETWQIAHTHSVCLLKSLYSQEENSKNLIRHLIELRSEIEMKRKLNIVGSLLNYHFHRSTKYFSKWIEAKNRVL